ncbi:MAG: 4-(cytidine 5'-diphospho)-2-C-methyl-D-erythritol kinase [Nanoarchaeota archaeon]|nr:4-(cytidine 5'-diphospho)-2-C-methyl-D-erythritol kinase [Nanoarchaeota archaeon]
MKLQAHAKVNLTLDILGKRDDGFHSLKSVMQEISLHDEISLEEISEDAIEIRCSDTALENEDNICWKAAALIKRVFMITRGVRISLTKHIPAQAGLGGGSSDAAAVLKGLNSLWKLKLDEDGLMKLACELGSDVAFFIVGGTCLVSGRGEVVWKIEAPSFYYVIVVPSVSVSTKDAYSAVDLLKVGKNKASEAFVKEFSSSCIYNDFEESVFRKHPELGQIKVRLLEAGAKAAFLAGSGSCVVGIIDERSKKLVQEYLKNEKLIFAYSANIPAESRL